MTAFLSPLVSHNERGISLLETVASLALFSAVLALGLPMTRFLAHQVASSTRKEKQMLAADGIQQSIHRGFRESQRLFSIEGIALHAPSDSKLQRYHPMPESTPISFLSLIPQLSLQALSTPDEYCLFSSTTNSRAKSALSSTKAWVGINVDSYFLLRGTLKRQKKTSNRCATGHLYEGRLLKDEHSRFNVYRGNIESNSDRHLILLPVDEMYTLLLDRNGIFRRISLTSSENQPLEYDTEHVHISIKQKTTKTRTYQIAITIRGPKKNSALTLRSEFITSNPNAYDHLNLLL